MFEFSDHAMTLDEVKKATKALGYEKLLVTIENKSYEISTAINLNGVILLVPGNEVVE